MTVFNPEALKFVIQVNDKNSCDVQNIQGGRTLQPHSPFNRASQCNYMSNQKLYEVEISWDPPQEPPTCNSSSDCKEWPNSTCNMRDGILRRCFCDENFKWNVSSLICTQGEDAIHQVYYKVEYLFVVWFRRLNFLAVAGRIHRQ